MAHTPPGRTRARVWGFVRERLLAGDPPTVREVQEAFGFRAVESARAHLEALVEGGFLEKDSGRARGYRLARRTGPSPVLVPLLGRVQAGALTTAVEEAEGAVAVQTRAPAEDLFALHVRGESMRDAGILDGDLVIVRRQATAEDGSIVVALVGDEATVKRLRRVRLAGGGTRVELHPENPAFEVIVPAAHDVRLLGRVIEVRRHLEPAALPSWESAAPPLLPEASSAARSPERARPRGGETPRRARIRRGARPPKPS